MAPRHDWTYDYLLSVSEQGLRKDRFRLKEIAHRLRTARTELLDMQADLATSAPRVRGLIQSDIKVLEDRIAQLESENQPQDYWFKWAIETVGGAKPFLVGPATIDSLINYNAGTYDYVKNGKVPFDNLFFELFEPVRMPLPIVDGDREIIGIGLSHERDILEWQMELQAKFLEKGKVLDIAKRRYQVDIWTRPHEHPDGIKRYPGLVQFRFFGENVGKFEVASTPHCFGIDVDLHRGTVTTDMLYLHDRKKVEPLSVLPNYQSLPIIANLCVNLINYINAHNVTLVARDRRPDIAHTSADRERKMQRYYVIQIKDDIRNLYPSTRHEEGKNWTLRERVYVRGHNRRYRDEKGDIYMTIWIEPYVRGPPNAPWRDQRYHLLAQKLLEEQRLMKEYQ